MTDDALNRRKAAASVTSALLLLGLLSAFALLLKTNARCLYIELDGAISVYVVIMVGLALSCWLLTWVYIVWINRIEMKERK